MPYEKKTKYAGSFKAQGSRFKKSEQKPVYKPKRGTLAPLMKEEAIMVHGSWLKVKGYGREKI